nr:DUF2330 domain-containing protein [Vampirovibrio sp.]
QELFVYMLTKDGRVETTNYRTTKIPTGQDIPLYVKEEFGDFYKAMFSQQVKKDGMHAVYLEYAWNMNNCDPCAADPLSKEELRELGVFWVQPPPELQKPVPFRNGRRIMPPRRPWPGGAQPVFVTRLHLRYNAANFPEDLKFQETKDRSNFQGRYVLRHPWKGESSCEAATRYRQGLPKKFDKQAQNLAHLTGWDITNIRTKMAANGQGVDGGDSPVNPLPWYQQLWGQQNTAPGNTLNPNPGGQPPTQLPNPMEWFQQLWAPPAK